VTRVAVLGLGAMGLPIATRLAETGHDVRAWSRRARPELDSVGAVFCASPAEAVTGADFVLTVLADDAALSEVLTGEEYGVRLAPGQVVVNLGTVAVATIQAVAATLVPAGVAVVDAGMLGNARHAAEGQLRFYVGGTGPEVAAAIVLLGDIGKETAHVGDLGAGMTLKLVLNLVMGLEMQALAEAVALGTALGLDRATVLDTIGGSGFSAPVMSFKARRMTSRHYDAPEFRLALMTKDLGLADEAAAAHALTTPMTRAAFRAHAAACAAGWGEADCAAIVEGLETSTSHRLGSNR
jgi:3-hydroxyisobutyrate dehydrogenase